MLWLVPDESRVGVLAKVISRQPTEARALFAVALSEQAVARLRQGAG